MDGAIQLLVIADDLTGSNDAGAQFAKRGIRSLVIVEPGIFELPHGYSVVVVNTESRHVSAEEAARRVKRIVELRVKAGVRHFFKKTDSTLRGNIGAELKALLEGTGEKWIPFVPAFPEMGRTTEGGIHLVDGVPISETAFANDPLCPVRASQVTEVLAGNASLRVGGSNTPVMPHEECTVFDCNSADEMSLIARELKARGALRVLAGSARFAEELARIIEFPSERRIQWEASGPIFFVNGSLNPRALEQVAVGSDLFRKVKLTTEHLFEGGTPDCSLERSGDVMLCSVEEREELAGYEAEARRIGISGAELHHMVAERQGRIVKELLERGAFGTVVIFGGDTLMGIARAMGWRAFVPRGEVEAGVTVSAPLAVGGLTVVSKAGGFGDRDVLRRIVDWVRH